jgi:hypothetical protein
MLLDFARYGLPILTDPAVACDADPGTVQRALLAASAVMASLANEVHTAQVHAERKKLQGDYDNVRAYTMVLMNVSRTERQLSGGT